MHELLKVDYRTAIYSILHNFEVRIFFLNSNLPNPNPKKLDCSDHKEKEKYFFDCQVIKIIDF